MQEIVDLIIQRVEECEEYFRMGEYESALNELQDVFESENSYLDTIPDVYCYAHLICVEALMQYVPYDDESIQEHMRNAVLCNNLIDDAEQKKLYELCINIDYSKFFLDRERYDEAETFVKASFWQSFWANTGREEFDDMHYTAIRNMFIYLHYSDILSYSDERFSEYEPILQLLSQYDFSDCGYIFHVLSNFVQADRAFRVNDFQRGKDKFRCAYEIELANDELVPFTYAYIYKIKYKMDDYLDADTIKDVLFSIARSTPSRIKNIIVVQNEGDLLTLTSQITLVLRWIVSYVNLGIVKCTDEEYLEILVNLKNLYPNILAFHNQLKKGYEPKIGWLSVNEIKANIPDDALYIDFVQYPHILREELILADLYVSTLSAYKKDGRLYIVKQESLNLLQQRLIHTLLNALTRTTKDNIMVDMFKTVVNSGDSLNKTLYGMILGESLEKSPCNLKTLLISADAELSNIPFAILMDESGNYVVEKYKIILINSLRNYKGELEIKNLNYDNAMVIGNPQYTLDRSIVGEYEYLKPLPLSKMEARIVSGLLGVRPHIRTDANINLLQKVESEILHLATHGEVLAIEEEEDGIVFPLSRCCVYLTGANDYMIKGEPDSMYGSGILTAQDMCRCDMSAVKLAVLSVCFAGNGEIDYSQGMLGVKTALQGQGVSVIVSCVWEVDDFASVVFMNEFYKNIKIMKASDALRKAQLYLKDVTIWQLKEEGWFTEQRIRQVGLVAQQMLEMSNRPYNDKPFSNPRYWAGFAVLVQ